jgi:pyridoxal phosphate enzyme (YggS family)
MAGAHVTLEALERVRERIAGAGGDPDAVRVVAVTKGHPVERVAEVVASGLVDIGESYAQELVAKAEALPDHVDASVRWHFIGHLQRNKVKQVAGFVHLWQSVDRLSLAAEVAHRAPGALVLVQVTVARLEQQGGCPPERVAAVVEGCRDLGLDVRGLMAIGPRGSDAEVRAAFRTVRTLADDLGLPERSMGMSGDLEAAIAEGSTMVRIGTDLVGPRSGP